jgi:hypothetical protein
MCNDADCGRKYFDCKLIDLANVFTIDLQVRLWFYPDSSAPATDYIAEHVLVDKDVDGC